MSILRELPPAKVNEVIDFAEYLKSKTRQAKSLKQRSSELPLYKKEDVNPDPLLSLVAEQHDQWFREQVITGLEQANDPNTVWVSNEAVKAMGVKHRAAWFKQAQGHLG
jgi:hypothetical protein